MSELKRKQINKNLVEPYDLFIALLSILSIINIVLYVAFSDKAVLYVIGIIDLLLSIFFFIDFLRKWIRAKSKPQYFAREYGWADLLASFPMPQFKIFRIFRIIKAYRTFQDTGLRNVARELIKNQASSALFTIIFLIILLLEFASIAILYVEMKNPQANIDTASDAIWWVYVTITTVGYGDKYPITLGGRVVGVLVMSTGVGLFGVLTGFLANKFVPKGKQIEKYEKQIKEMNESLDEIKQLLSKNKK
ncbi:ion transporter [Candidatus Saccharibacteria bacterium CPR2]|nr:ion transporter [Candidatus Saccharibacteria bacterium CPR2]